MNPKWVGFLGFEDVSASDLTGAADVFAAVTLDGGYGNRISCYQVCTIGFSSERLRSESGISFIQTFQRAFERRFGSKPRSYLKNRNVTSMIASSNRESSERE